MVQILVGANPAAIWLIVEGSSDLVWGEIAGRGWILVRNGGTFFAVVSVRACARRCSQSFTLTVEAWQTLSTIKHRLFTS